jgi:hypothetical protein
MTDHPPFSSPDFAEAFAVQERQDRLHTGKIACLLVVLLMPLGIVLDYFVYPRDMGFFLTLRLAWPAVRWRVACGSSIPRNSGTGITGCWAFPSPCCRLFSLPG